MAAVRRKPAHGIFVFGPPLRLGGARRVALVGTCRPVAGRGPAVQIRLAIEDDLFSGAFEPQLCRQHDHMTVI
jgi:hypothetical protein